MTAVNSAVERNPGAQRSRSQAIAAHLRDAAEAEGRSDGNEPTAIGPDREEASARSKATRRNPAALRPERGPGSAGPPGARDAAAQRLDAPNAGARALSGGRR